jgi:hypothetical protein
MSTTTEKQTAVDFLEEQILLTSPSVYKLMKEANAFNHAKKIHEEQIIDAVDETISEMSMYKSSMTYENGEQYYKETFNK